MKDWFRDNLKVSNKIVGSHDNRNNEYNIALKEGDFARIPVKIIGVAKYSGGPFGPIAHVMVPNGLHENFALGNLIFGDGIIPGTTIGTSPNSIFQDPFTTDWRLILSYIPDVSSLGTHHNYNVSGTKVYWKTTLLSFAQTQVTQSLLQELSETKTLTQDDVIGYLGMISDNTQVLSFDEKARGWVSFKSFTQMQFALSMANDYYTFAGGRLFRHYEEGQDRNTFYGIYNNSTIDVLLNDDPGSIKSFHTLNYEGSQAKVDLFVSQEINGTTYNDQEYYNLSAENGWFVESITTDKEEGFVSEFLEKEGKWFNNINRTIDLNKVETSDFSFQGIGRIEFATTTSSLAPMSSARMMDPNSDQYTSQLKAKIQDPQITKSDKQVLQKEVDRLEKKNLQTLKKDVDELEKEILIIDKSVEATKQKEAETREVETKEAETKEVVKTDTKKILAKELTDTKKKLKDAEEEEEDKKKRY